MRASRLLITLLAGPAFVTSVPAQQAPLFTDSLREGLRVRIYAPGIVRFPNATGVVASLKSDGFMFKDDRTDLTHGLLPISLERITTLEVSRGKKITGRRLLAGAGIGFIAGLGLTQFLDLMQERNLNPDRRNSCVEVLNSCVSRSALMIGTITGTSAGLIVAASSPSEIWRPVRIR